VREPRGCTLCTAFMMQ